MQNMNEHRTIFPISGEEIIRLNIDQHVSPDEMCAVSLTAADLDRGYHRWKNVMQAPDPKDNEMTEQLYLTLWNELEKAAKELTETGHRINKLKSHTFEQVKEIGKLELQKYKLEQKVILLTSDKSSLDGLAKSRENQIKQLQKDIENANKLIDRYQGKYKTLNMKLNWFQRAAAFIFRI